MLNNVLNIILGFFEGFALILSPCILPILPIILASSLANAYKLRPMGITAGFVVTFTLVAFFSRQWVNYLGIDLNLIRHIAYFILALLGLVMLSSTLSERFSQWIQRGIGSRVTLHPTQAKAGFWSGFCTGGLVAIIWTPCAGPILAAVIVQIVIQQSNFVSFLTLLAFALGAAVPMLFIAVYGRDLLDKFSFFKQHGTLFRKVLGMIIILSVAYSVWQEQWGTSSTSAQETPIRTATMLQRGLWRPYQAPAILGINTWINSAPLQISALKNHVVLIDFWTYSCINCIRTLPHLKRLYQQYKNQGLIIIGVHTPEFDFEKKAQNVQQAVIRDGIQYPVALDNHFMTWRNFHNKYWPAQYLINQQGQVVYEHFGEGDADILENNIRFLLGVKSLALSAPDNHENSSLTQTPETYLGFTRANERHAPRLSPNQTHTYAFLPTLSRHAWTLQGDWQVNADNIVAKQANAGLKIHFKARFVYVVMGKTTPVPLHVKVRLNGKKLVQFAGEAVSNGRILVNQQSIYAVVALPSTQDGVLELTTEEPGLSVYTFTFGE